MNKPKLGFKTLTNEEKLRLTRLVADRMGENATLFPSPNPPLVTLINQVEAIEARIAARASLEQQAQALSIEIRGLFDGLENLMGREVDYVHLIANGDANKVAASGFPLAGTPGLPVEMPKVEGLQASYGDADGTIDLQWDPVPCKARLYSVEVSEAADGQSGWSLLLQQSSSRATVSGLISGKRYWFRVRAIGSAGPGAPSDAVTRTAP